MLIKKIHRSGLFPDEIKQGVGLASLMTFIVGFNPLLIFIASFFNRKSTWKIAKLDIWCGILSILGIILWYVTQEPNVAILFSIFADFIAAVPTIAKSWQEPESENYHVFLASAISGGLALLTIDQWTFAHYAFPLYIFLICAVFFALIKFELGKKLFK